MERENLQLQEHDECGDHSEQDARVFLLQEYEQRPEVGFLVPGLETLQQRLFGIEIVLVASLAGFVELHFKFGSFFPVNSAIFLEFQNYYKRKIFE